MNRRNFTLISLPGIFTRKSQESQAREPSDGVKKTCVFLTDGAKRPCLGLVLHMRDFHYSREQIIERATFTASDRTLIGRCRGDQNRLGFAYQTAFVRLTGRFPAQQPFEIQGEILSFVSAELDTDPEEIRTYALRRPPVSEHQEQIRQYLRLRRFGESERAWLEEFVFREALRLEQPSALIGKAQQVLQQEQVLVPAVAMHETVEDLELCETFPFHELFEIECQENGTTHSSRVPEDSPSVPVCHHSPEMVGSIQVLL